MNRWRHLAYGTPPPTAWYDVSALITSSSSRIGMSSWAMLTAYDMTRHRSSTRLGIPVLMVGDSAANKSSASTPRSP